MGKSTIFQWPCSIAFCMFTRGKTSIFLRFSFDFPMVFPLKIPFSQSFPRVTGWYTISARPTPGQVSALRRSVPSSTGSDSPPPRQWTRGTPRTPRRGRKPEIRNSRCRCQVDVLKSDGCLKMMISAILRHFFRGQTHGTWAVAVDVGSWNGT